MFSFGAMASRQRWGGGGGSSGYPMPATAIGSGGMGTIGNPMAQGFAHNAARNAARQRGRGAPPPQQGPMAPVAPPVAPPPAAPQGGDPDGWDWNKPVGSGPNRMNPGDDRGYRSLPGNTPPPVEPYGPPRPSIGNPFSRGTYNSMGGGGYPSSIRR